MTIREQLQSLPTSIERLAEHLGLVPEHWPGNCATVADGLAHLEGGMRVRGHYLGPVSDECIIEAWRNMPFVCHEWVLDEDGQIVDPTRWVFEGVEPYIYRAYNRGEYDRGGQRLRSVLTATRPMPEDTGGEKHILWLSREASAHMRTICPDQPLTAEQIMWIANHPISAFGPHALEVYEAISAIGFRAFIPLDNRKQAQGE